MKFWHFVPLLVCFVVLLCACDALAARKGNRGNKGNKNQGNVQINVDRRGNVKINAPRGSSVNGRRLGSNGFQGHHGHGHHANTVTLDGTPLRALRVDHRGQLFTIDAHGRRQFAGFAGPLGSPAFSSHHADTFVDEFGNVFEQDNFGNVRYRGNAFRGSAVVVPPGFNLRLGSPRSHY